MPRPKNKTELLALSQFNFDKLSELVNSLPRQEQLAQFPPGTMNRNIRDVLAHLHEWHLMFLYWYEVGMAGSKPIMPAKGYTWNTTPELNRKILEQYQKHDLADIRHKLNASFKKLRKIIENHTNVELFEKKHYKWTGSTSLGSYLVSASSSHYDWAYKLIKKAKG